jgi:serine/threonine protein kinase
VGLHDNFENPKYIFLVLELCSGGDLSSFIKKNKNLPEKVAQSFLKQLANGLLFLYQQSIIHRDLKPANVLLSEASEFAV